jgi:hypothetical protein
MNTCWRRLNIVTIAVFLQVCTAVALADEKQCEAGKSAAPSEQRVVDPVVTAQPRADSTKASTLVAFPAAVVHDRMNFRYIAPTADFANATESTLASPLGTTSVWDRLKDYRSRGNVQVLTLWQSRHFMFSLQSGRNGTANLQWTTKSLGHDEGKRGLLDGMFHRSDATTQEPTATAGRDKH